MFYKCIGVVSIYIRALIQFEKLAFVSYTSFIKNMHCYVYKKLV